MSYNMYLTSNLEKQVITIPFYRHGAKSVTCFRSAALPSLTLFTLFTKCMQGLQISRGPHRLLLVHHGLAIAFATSGMVVLGLLFASPLLWISPPLPPCGSSLYSCLQESSPLSWETISLWSCQVYQYWVKWNWLLGMGWKDRGSQIDKQEE